jgi:hypothetical protein
MWKETAVGHLNIMTEWMGYGNLVRIIGLGLRIEHEASEATVATTKRDVTI